MNEERSMRYLHCQGERNERGLLVSAPIRGVARAAAVQLGKRMNDRRNEAFVFVIDNGKILKSWLPSLPKPVDSLVYSDVS